MVIRGYEDRKDLGMKNGKKGSTKKSCQKASDQNKIVQMSYLRHARVIRGISCPVKEYRQDKLHHDPGQQTYRIKSKLIEDRIQTNFMRSVEYLERPSIGGEMRPGNYAPSGEWPCIV